MKSGGVFLCLHLYLTFQIFIKMNFKILFTILGFSSLFIHAFEPHTAIKTQTPTITTDTTKTPLPDRNAATVEQIRGVYVFVNSKPIRPYKYLGNVTASAMSFTPLNSILKRCQDKYPEADGLIFHEATISFGDAIKFIE